MDEDNHSDEILTDGQHLIDPNHDDGRPQSSNDEQLLKNVRNRFSILEPIVFPIFFAWSFSGTVFQNQIIYQSCTASFGFNETDCIQLGKENSTQRVQEIETIVQPFAANILMAKSIIESILPALISLFIGPWSDKYGRKPLLLIAYSGYFTVYFAMTVISFISSKILLSPWAYIIAYIPISLSGGNCILVTGLFCYLSDISTEENRARKMMLIQVVLYLGILSGLLSTGYVFALTSATTIFGICSCCLLLSIFYIVFLIDESVNVTTAAQTKYEKLKGLFDCQLVVDMFKTCFKKRQNFNRSIILLTIFTFICITFVFEGVQTVFYLFVRKKFNLSLQEYTNYEAANIVSFLVGNAFGMSFLNKVLGVSDIMLALLGFISALGESIIRSIAYCPWHLYLGIIIAFLKTLPAPMGRSFLVKYVATNEMGKVLSFSTSLEAITPLIGSSLYNFVYRNTINVYPGAFNIISTVIYFNCLFIVVVIYILHRKYYRSDYDELRT